MRSSLSQIHKLARTSKLSKNETCSLCLKTMNTFFAHGYKCSQCLLVFHAKCVQQGLSAAQVPFLAISFSFFDFILYLFKSLLLLLKQALPPVVFDCTNGRSRTSVSGGDKDKERQSLSKQVRKASRETVESVGSGASASTTSAGASASAQENSNWNLTGTSEFTDSVQDVVNCVEQLQRLDEFIARKIHQLGNQGGNADRVFLSALREFKGIFPLGYLNPRNIFRCISTHHRHELQALSYQLTAWRRCRVRR